MKINERAFRFAIMIIDAYKYLMGNKEYVLSKQLLKSRTSIGANIEEAQAAQSKADFIAKMSIASKEARETKYWLRLLIESNYLCSYDKIKEIMLEIDNIMNILTKIIKTSKENHKKGVSKSL